MEDLVDSLQANDLLPVIDAPVGHALVDLVAFEHFEQLVLAALRHPSRHFGLLRVPEDHEQVLEVIVRWEEEIAGEHLRDDAADGPHIARILPVAALQYHFGRAILPSVDDGTVFLLRVRRASEIYQLDLIRRRQHVILQLSMRSLLQVLPAQQDVLRLEVGVRVLVGMHESDGLEHLPGECLYHFNGKAGVIIAFDDIVKRGT